MTFRTRLSLAAAFLALVQTGIAAAAQRAYVASNGVDGGACTLTAPCRSFAFAMTSVDSGGEIVALDAAGYGAVTINKSVTITANPGVFAGIAASTGNAVTITAGATDRVVLRNLQINGIGATNGIVATSVGRLTLENCVISNFSVTGGHGIHVHGGGSMILRAVDTIVRDNYDGVKVSNGADASLTRMAFFGNSNSALRVANNTGSTTGASLSDSVVADHFNVAIYAEGNHATGVARIFVARSTISTSFVALAASGPAGQAQITIGQSMVSANGYGHYVVGPQAAIYTSGNNTFAGNSTSAGTLTYLAPQ